MTDELITIGTYGTPFEGYLVKSVLEAFEVDAVLVDENLVNTNWLWSNALGGVKVQVPESEAEAAREILAQCVWEVEEAEAPASMVTICPACGSDNTRNFLDRRASFVSLIVLGFPLLPAKPKMVCSNCEHEWNSAA